MAVQPCDQRENRAGTYDSLSSRILQLESFDLDTETERKSKGGYETVSVARYCPFCFQTKASCVVHIPVLQSQEELKIAVTGYRGFIASHLIPELGNEKLSLIEQEDYPLLARVDGVDVVVHLGAIAGARPDVAAYDYFDFNVKRTVDLLEAARHAHARKFIFISTCTVSQGVRNIYDVSKVQGEQWCELYRRYIEDVVILRLYNVYGERDTKSVIYKFVSAIENDRPIIVHGKGKQTRDFIYVKDVVGAIKKALYSDKLLNKAFEIGTGNEESIIGLAHLIFEITGKKVPIEYGPLPYAQLESAKCPDPSFVENPTPLEIGLKALLKHQK